MWFLLWWIGAFLVGLVIGFYFGNKFCYWSLTKDSPKRRCGECSNCKKIQGDYVLCSVFSLTRIPDVCGRYESKN